MNSKAFQISLLLSLVMHVCILWGSTAFKVKVKPSQARQIEVTYQTVKQKNIKVDLKETKSIKRVEHKNLKKLNLLDKGTGGPTFFEKKLMDVSKFSDKVHLGRKYSPKIDPIDSHRTIKIPMIKSEKITNPKYLSYNQTIRQKIRSRAYNHIDHPEFKSGEVYLTFVVSSVGRLIDLKVINHKTTANEYLRNVGLRSIRESSPFPAFPKDLSYPELTFNIIITFELND